MPRPETVSLLGIHQSLETVSAREIGIQPIYVARRKASEQQGRLWTPESYARELPFRYRQPQARAIFGVLTDMADSLIDRHGQMLRADNIFSEHVKKAENILLESPERFQNSQLYIPEASKEEANRDAYPIRGHHLKFFAFFLNNPKLKDPLAIAKDITFEQHNLGTKIRNNRRKYKDIAEWYQKDTLDGTAEQMKQYLQDNEIMFTIFRDSPDDTPVDLLAGQKDLMCESCAVGAHCGLRRWELRPHGTVEHDQHYIAAFVHEAIRLGVTRDFKRITKSVSFSDAPDEQVEGIRTTIGTVKTVLRKSAVDWPDLAAPPELIHPHFQL